MKDKKKRSFSKCLLVFDYLIAVVLVIVAIIYAFKSDSYSNQIAGMVDVWIGQTAAITAAYLWKSKCENRAKYAQEWYERIMKDPEISPEKIDAAIRITETITRD